MNIQKKIVILILLLSFLMSCVPIFAALPDDRYTVIAAGSMHSLALKSDGTIVAWGSNESGQLGLGENVDKKTTPTKLSTTFITKGVTAGYEFSAAVDSKGNVYMWGKGADGSIMWKLSQVYELKNIVAISAGQKRLIALDVDGIVYECTNRSNIRKLSISNPVVSISAGGDFYMALDNLGNVYTWGSNSNGQLGIDGNENKSVPTKVSSLSNIVSIAAGYTHALAVDDSGIVWAWGSNEKGELGYGGTKEQISTPTKVKDLENAKSVSAGKNSSLALLSDGTVFSWGYGEYGQNGNKTLKDQTTPKQVDTVKNVVQITNGVHHNLCLTSSGQVYAWGRNASGQIGSKSEGTATSPVSVIENGIPTKSYHKNMMTYGASSWAVSELDGLYHRNLLGLYPWRNYQSNMTRGEFAAILVDIYESKKDKSILTSEGSEFTDIVNSPYREKIIKAVRLKIVNGRSDKTFDPNGYLTRQEAAKMISTFNVSMIGGSNSFDKGDVSEYRDSYNIASWAVPYVFYTSKNNIMNGSSDKNFYPTKKLSKEEGLILVARLAEKYSW